MATIYFPGCKYTAHSPENSAKLGLYLMEHHHMSVVGCCSTYHQSLTNQDTAVYICTTCRAILQESAPQAKLVSIWEVLAQDDTFPWPNYKGLDITVQDCWRSREDRAMQYAVRHVLKRLNCNVHEIEANYDKSEYCGVTLLNPPHPRYEQLVPKRFIENAGDKFHAHSQEEQAIQMKAHCAQFQTETVACYCTGCLTGLKIGGVKGVHLMDLLWP